MKTRKLIALLLTLVMLTAVFSACATKTDTDTPGASPNESVTGGDNTGADADTDADSNTGASNAAADAIRAAGVLKIGCKEDVPNFGLLNTATNEYEGFEIELAKLIANDIFGDPAKVRFQAVTAKTRGPLLDNGDVDMVIATFTITEERKLSYNFSDPYYQDAVGMLVRRDSGIESIADCDGKTIGVAQSATSKDAIQAAADAAGVSVTFNEYGTYPEIQAALNSGNVDVFCVDRSILRGYLSDDLVLTEDKFSPQDYGVTTKFENKELADYVNGLINGWLDDGTIAALVEQFGL
ncbi:MAG: transporter substrate-binding domain-containing protein [Oscillospiraceae bacterium]|jgi:putative glutamine transport system substrate-binding protein|nr:transporter substrate-binding domain-containing protein [Oscillospiraceae bacterium]